jgi:hypothetical protein
MTKALYQLNLRLNVASESRSFYSDLSYIKAIAELRGAKYCISTAVASCLHYMGYQSFALEVRKQASPWCELPGDMLLGA